MVKKVALTYKRFLGKLLTCYILHLLIKEGLEMEITEIIVAPVDEEKLKAYVNITIDSCFVVRGLKVIKGLHGLFVAMPNKKTKNGFFRDVVHPINAETRQMIETKVMEAYVAEVAKSTPVS
jgi:stage V sporulation protein G